jgi:hypothetical protein
MIRREGLCTTCKTKLVMEAPEDWDENRFYRTQTIDCPICWNTAVLMRRVNELSEHDKQIRENVLDEVWKAISWNALSGENKTMWEVIECLRAGEMKE